MLNNLIIFYRVDLCCHWMHALNRNATETIASSLSCGGCGARIFCTRSLNYIVMLTRSKNTKLNLLQETPGSQHLSIEGRKLPTYRQILLCFIAHRDKLRREDGSKRLRINTLASNAVIEQIEHHYNHANISLIPYKYIHRRIRLLRL